MGRLLWVIQMDPMSSRGSLKVEEGGRKERQREVRTERKIREAV